MQPLAYMPFLNFDIAQQMLRYLRCIFEPSHLKTLIKHSQVGLVIHHL